MRLKAAVSRRTSRGPVSGSVTDGAPRPKAPTRSARTARGRVARRTMRPTMTRIAIAISPDEISDGQGIGTGSARMRVWALSQPPSENGTEASTSKVSPSAGGRPLPGGAVDPVGAPVHGFVGRRPVVAAVDDGEARRLAKLDEHPLELEGGERELVRARPGRGGALLAHPVADAGGRGRLGERRAVRGRRLLQDARDRGHALEEARPVGGPHRRLPVVGEHDEAQRLRHHQRGEEERDELAAETELREPHAPASVTSAAST